MQGSSRAAAAVGQQALDQSPSRLVGVHQASDVRLAHRVHRSDREEVHARVAGMRKLANLVSGKQLHGSQVSSEYLVCANQARLIGGVRRVECGRTRRYRDIGRIWCDPGQEVRGAAQRSGIVVDARYQHRVSDKGACEVCGEVFDALKDGCEDKRPVGAVELAPGTFVYRVDLHRYQVGMIETCTHLFTPQQGTVGDHRDRDLEVAQHLDMSAQPTVERRLTVRNERKVIDRESASPELPDPSGDGLVNLRRAEKSPRFDDHFGRRSDLAIDAGVAARLRGDVVDAETLAQST